MDKITLLISLSLSANYCISVGNFIGVIAFKSKKKDGNWDRRNRLSPRFSLHKPDTPLCLLFYYSMNIRLMCDILALDLMGFFKYAGTDCFYHV